VRDIQLCDLARTCEVGTHHPPVFSGQRA
jgi:hypothetical protein